MRAGRHLAIRAEYDRAAADYDRRWARYNHATLALLRPWMAGRDLGRMVDVSCGTANLLPLVVETAERIDRYVGVDLAPEMLRMAWEKAGGTGMRTAFAAADAGALPFRAGSFDTAVTASALHYWDDARAGLMEIRRVLRPDGRLLLLDWWRDPPSMRLLNAWMRVTRVEYRRMYSRAEMAEALESTGFRIDAEARGGAGGPWRVIAFEARAV
jgi:ubiquinone/menaquinone biosynthesis C-methylase UbiE